MFDVVLKLTSKVQDVRFTAHVMPASLLVTTIWGSINNYCPIFVV